MISEICERANSVRIKKKLAFRPRLSCQSDTWSPDFCSLVGWSTKLYVGAVSFRRNETCFRSYDHNQELVSNKRLQSQLTFHLNLPHDLHTTPKKHTAAVTNEDLLLVVKRIRTKHIQYSSTIIIMSKGPGEEETTTTSSSEVSGPPEKMISTTDSEALDDSSTKATEENDSDDTMGSSEEKKESSDAETEADEADDKSPEEKEKEAKEKEEAEKKRIEELKIKYKDWPLKDVKEPHENDVMYGRGGGTNHHPGNKRYRKMVEERKVQYVNSKRLDKPLVALEIIREWRAQLPPGRFLKHNEKTGNWDDVGDKKAREKTSQALREKAPIIRAQQEEQLKVSKISVGDLIFYFFPGFDD